MWIYSVRNVLNYSSVVPYASQGRSPAGAGLGLLRSRFWGHRRYSGVLSVEAPAFTLVRAHTISVINRPLFSVSRHVKKSCSLSLMRFDNWTDLASRHVPLRLDDLAVNFEIFTEHLEDPSEQLDPPWYWPAHFKSPKNCS